MTIWVLRGVAVTALAAMWWLSRVLALARWQVAAAGEMSPRESHRPASSSTPAMKAPSEAERPASSITRVMPTTVSSALAVMASFTLVRAMRA